MVLPFLLSFCFRLTPEFILTCPALPPLCCWASVVRSFHQPVSRVRFSVALPVLLVVAAYSAFIVGQSRKWIHTATTTTIVLDQISRKSRIRRRARFSF